MTSTTDGTQAGAARRGRPRDAAADDRILRSAFEQLIDVGYGNLSIEQVALAAGVAKTTIYRRYPTKRELVLASLRREAPFVSPPPDMSTHDALDRFVRGAVAALIDSGAMRILGSLLLEDEREPGLQDAFRARIVEPRRAMVVTMLERGVARGELRPDTDPLLVTEMVAGAVFAHHVILGLPTSDAWLDSLVDHVWRSIAAN